MGRLFYTVLWTQALKIKTLYKYQNKIISLKKKRILYTKNQNQTKKSIWGFGMNLNKTLLLHIKLLRVLKINN